MIRVQVAADSYLMRAALSTLIGFQDGMEIVGEKEEGEPGAIKCDGISPDVAVISEQWGTPPERSVALMREACPAVKIIMLRVSGRASDGDTGADATLGAFAKMEELAAAIRQVAR